jgi:hypothetical protein
MEFNPSLVLKEQTEVVKMGVRGLNPTLGDESQSF